MENPKFLPFVVSNTIGTVINEPIQMVRSMIASFVWYNIDASNFRWSIDQSVMMKYFHHMPESVNPVAIDHPENSHDYAAIPGTHVDMCRFRNTNVFLEMEMVRQQSTESSNTYQHLSIRFRVLYTKTNIKNLKDFIRQLIKDTKEVERLKSKKIYNDVEGPACMHVPNRPNRSFDDVFIPRKQREEIINKVTKFNESEQWYREHKIPYHFGIMLHGNPGTGKSSIVQAIINLIDCDVYYVKTDTLMQSIERNNWIRYAGKDRMRVIIIEDIDTATFTHSRDMFSNNNHSSQHVQSMLGSASLNSLMNMMDGFACNDKVIYIFTTNHLDKLDPALIRPGRIDLSLEIGYVNSETFDQFCEFHYGQSSNKPIIVRDGITCAELQTKVMEGCTLEDLIEYVKEEN